MTSAAGEKSGVGVVELEVTVTTGRLRVYLGEAGQTRGPWFEKGYVKGTDSIFHVMAKIYTDAEPGKPARMHGHMEQFPNRPYYFYVEPLEGPPVTGMSYRAWRDD